MEVLVSSTASVMDDNVVFHDDSVVGEIRLDVVATSNCHMRRMNAEGVTLPLRPREMGGDNEFQRVRIESAMMKYSSVDGLYGLVVVFFGVDELDF